MFNRITTVLTHYPKIWIFCFSFNEKIKKIEETIEDLDEQLNPRVIFKVKLLVCKLYCIEFHFDQTKG